MISPNIYMYGTTDISYVENVSSSIKQEDNVEGEEINIINNDKSNEVASINSNIAKLIGEYNEEDEYSLVFGEELAEYNYVYKSYKDEDLLDKQFSDVNTITTAELGDTETIEIDTPEDAVEEVIELESLEVEKIKPKSATFTNVDQSSSLLEIENPDPNYKGTIVTLDPADRSLLEHLVMGEAGGEGVEGAALVAQAIRDTMVYRGFSSVAEVRSALKYTGSINKTPNQSTLDAVSYIFDQGGNAVQHSIFYFYAPRRCTSSFHESQQFIIQYGGHRFFSTW